jgi:hypothetical protein
MATTNPAPNPSGAESNASTTSLKSAWYSCAMCYIVACPAEMILAKAQAIERGQVSVAEEEKNDSVSDRCDGHLAQ